MSERHSALSPLLIITGAAVGLLFAVLGKLGNPPNMGVCIVCFIRDLAGGIGLHKIKAVSYIRPEIIGLLLGATVAALVTKEFHARAGARPIVRFIIGILVGIGALVFLGCPIRMFGRVASGDWTALAGVMGLAAGVFVFNLLARQGLTMGRAREIPPVVGWVLPVLMVGLLILVAVDPAGAFGQHKGHAPLFISLIAGLLLGVLGQRSGFCSIGGTSDVIMIRSVDRVQGTAALLIAALVGNLALGLFKPGAHPIAHTAHLWSFLSMFVVGLGSMMLGGCPFKQTVMTGQGNVDAAVSFVGILAGTAVGHNLNLLASPAGVPVGGKVAVLIGIGVLILIGLVSVKKKQ